ncbi:MAG: BON domain-containing protein [Pyrinomonadaceae bacterium]
MRKLFLLTGTLLLAVSAAAAQTTTTQTTSPMTKQQTTKAPKTPKATKTKMTKPTDDAGIQTCINEKLGKSKMASEGFAATVSGGTATFTGSTKVAGHKGGVSGIAKSCGAKSVVNNITIEGKTVTPKTPKTTKSKATSTTPPKTT